MPADSVPALVPFAAGFVKPTIDRYRHIVLTLYITYLWSICTCRSRSRHRTGASDTFCRRSSRPAPAPCTIRRRSACRGIAFETRTDNGSATAAASPSLSPPPPPSHTIGSDFVFTDIDCRRRRRCRTPLRLSPIKSAFRRTPRHRNVFFPTT